VADRLKLNVNGIWIFDYITIGAGNQNGVKDPRKVNRVWFDGMVVSTKYVGPVAK
jgi:hypothetical protein